MDSAFPGSSIRLKPCELAAGHFLASVIPSGGHFAEVLIPAGPRVFNKVGKP